jgi:hypothetical protein
MRRINMLPQKAPIPQMGQGLGRLNRQRVSQGLGRINADGSEKMAGPKQQGPVPPIFSPQAPTEPVPPQSGQYAEQAMDQLGSNFGQEQAGYMQTMGQQFQQQNPGVAQQRPMPPPPMSYQQYQNQAFQKPQGYGSMQTGMGADGGMQVQHQLGQQQQAIMQAQQANQGQSKPLGQMPQYQNMMGWY